MSRAHLSHSWLHIEINPDFTAGDDHSLSRAPLGASHPSQSPPPHPLLTRITCCQTGLLRVCVLPRSRLCCAAGPSSVTQGGTPTVRHCPKPEERVGPLPAQLTALTSKTSKQQLACTAIDSYSRVQRAVSGYSGDMLPPICMEWPLTGGQFLHSAPLKSLLGPAVWVSQQLTASCWFSIM